MAGWVTCRCFPMMRCWNPIEAMEDGFVLNKGEDWDAIATNASRMSVERRGEIEAIWCEGKSVKYLSLGLQ